LRDTSPVAFDYVAAGRWKAGSGGGFNALEARHTAELVLEHFCDHPDQSLGVIAFSQRQQLQILGQLEKLRRDHPELEEHFQEDQVEPFFVKNLENVQGDERDVIFLSVGYGRDENGKLAMRFGPLNQQEGERRLNVAVTRARDRLIVISSLRAQDLDLSRSGAEGVRLLRAYLDYAERGPEALRAGITEAAARGFDSPFEQDVFEELTRRGLTVHPQVGCSGYRIDLAVVDPRAPGRYLLGVECDGATYHASHTARDRDRLRQEVLEALGWRVCRIWSTDWLHDRPRQVERVLAALEAAQKPRPIEARPTPARRPRLTQTTPKDGEPALVAVSYKSIDRVPEEVIADLLLATLRSCGATAADDLIPAVARQLGFKGTGSKIQTRLEASLEDLLRAGRVARQPDGRLQAVPNLRAVEQ